MVVEVHYRTLRHKCSCCGGSFFLVKDNLRVRILPTGYNQNGGWGGGSTTFYVLGDHHDS